MKKLLLLLIFATAVAKSQTYDIAVVGDGYKRNEQALFLSDLQIIKSELFLRPPCSQRWWQFNFIPLSWQNKFQCTQGTPFEGSYCNDAKVAAEVAAAGVHPQAYLVLIKSQGGGGAGAVCVVGMSFHDAVHSGSVGVHELGHALFGLPDGGGGIMASTCNQGACGYNQTFTSGNQQIINAILDQRATPFTGQLPSVIIMSPQNNFTTTTGGSMMVMAEVTNVTSVEFFWDGISKGDYVFWLRSYYPQNTVTWWISPLSAGNHILRLKAIGINNFSEQEVNITVN